LVQVRIAVCGIVTIDGLAVVAVDANGAVDVCPPAVYPEPVISVPAAAAVDVPESSRILNPVVSVVNAVADVIDAMTFWAMA
jgi:hypothetical protein